MSRLVVAKGEGLVTELDRASAELERLVPDVVAFSIDAVRSGVTVTYVAAGLDDDPRGAQAPQGAGQDEHDEHDDAGLADPLDEGAWHRTALAHAAPGIRSTLSLPVMDSGEVVGNVTVYARDETSLRGRQEQVARIFGAWAGGAVSNADLAFETRREAADAPDRLSELVTVDLAARMLAREKGLPVDHVRVRMHEAAARAGIPVVRLALLVIEEGHRPG